MSNRNGLWTVAFAMACSCAAHADIQIHNDVQGVTPSVVGYNLGIYRDGSNTLDWWRYSGIKTVRIFMSVSSLEPNDDISGTGDGVKTKTDFTNRQTLLRTDSSKPKSSSLSTKYVKWSYFEDSIDEAGESYTGEDVFPAMRSLGIEILANISATKSRFPLESNTEYDKMWELWQHYYAVSYILSRDYDVRRYSMYNEPNLSETMTVENWELRLRVVSDAIRAGIADMNKRYGKSLVAEILAPNTGGAIYDNGEGENWGRLPILNRHMDMFGDSLPTRRNLDVFNYQKYTLLQHSNSQYSGFIETCQNMKDGMAADMAPDPILPIALTEMNARTGSNYADQEETADTPKDFTSVGATAVALSNDCPADQLYLFKFVMTEGASDWDSKLAKNGTHYANISSTGANNIGGASGTAEVWRLYGKAAGSKRDRYSYSSDQDPDVWILATRDNARAVTYLYLANRTTANTPVGIDLSALNIPEGSVATVEEVSSRARGGVVSIKQVAGDRIDAGTMPAESVWLISIYEGKSVGAMQTVTASEDTQVRDGTGKSKVITPSATPLLARADGTSNGRQMALVKFALPSSLTGKRVLLALSSAQSIASATPTQAHVYGVEYDSWKPSTATFSKLTTVFKQSVSSNDMIANNVVKNQGTTSKIQGQLMVDSTTSALKYFDVTDFVTVQTDGKASFLIVQEHRWDYPPTAEADDSATGDTQSSGIAVSSRLGAAPPALLFY